MEDKMKCIKCKKPLGFANWGNVRDINNKSICCCKDCSEDILVEYKSQRIVENYSGVDIYIFEDRYYPYWGCSYSFETIEACRKRIDMKNVAVVPRKSLL
jgi:hypothetical protein